MHCLSLYLSSCCAIFAANPKGLVRFSDICNQAPISREVHVVRRNAWKKRTELKGMDVESKYVQALCIYAVFDPSVLTQHKNGVDTERLDVLRFDVHSFE